MTQTTQEETTKMNGLIELTQFFNEVNYCRNAAAAEVFIAESKACEARWGRPEPRYTISKIGRQHVVTIIRSRFSSNGPAAVAELLGD